MPIYEYRCNKCGNKIEILQKVSDPPVTTCSKCDGKMSKVISPAGLQFKGSGWYITDYSTKGKQTSEPSRPKKGPSDEKTSDKKEEKKAETAAPASSTGKTEPAT